VTTDTLAPAPASVPPARPSRRADRGTPLDVTTKIVVVVVVAVLFLLIVLPLINILSSAVSEKGMQVFTSIFTSEVNLRIIQNTVVLGIIVALLGTIIGFLLAYVQTRMDFRGKKLLHLIALLPIVSPPFALATAVITLFGRSGIITKELLGLTPTLYGLPGLTIVLTLSFFPAAYMNMLGMMKSLDPSLDEAASSLGANKFTIFRSVTLPMLVPGFASSFLLLFVETIADLANPLVIGGDFTVLSSRAYIAITGEYNVGAGAAYAVVLLLPAVIVFLIQRYWASRKSVVSVTGKPSGRTNMITSKPVRAVLLTLVGALALLIVGIYATVIIGGFVKILGVNNEFTWSHYTYVLSGIGSDAMVTTTLLALIATPIAGVLGLVIAWLIVRKLRRGKSWIDFLGMLGLAVPGTVLGIGYALTYNKDLGFGSTVLIPALAGGGAILGGSLAIIMVYIIRSSPSGQRSGVAALQQIDVAIDEASASLGATGVTTFRRVTLPLIKPALLSGLIYAFARSMTTLSPIIFITTPQTKIMTSQILSEVDSGRFGNAFAYCTILIIIVMTVIGILQLLIRDTKSAPRPAADLPTTTLG
jgi:iron(III) transport system permease protein